MGVCHLQQGLGNLVRMLIEPGRRVATPAAFCPPWLDCVGHGGQQLFDLASKEAGPDPIDGIEAELGCGRLDPGPCPNRKGGFANGIVGDARTLFWIRDDVSKGRSHFGTV